MFNGFTHFSLIQYTEFVMIMVLSITVMMMTIMAIAIMMVLMITLRIMVLMMLVIVINGTSIKAYGARSPVDPGTT